jgi:hypothetical protein
MKIYYLLLTLIVCINPELQAGDIYAQHSTTFSNTLVGSAKVEFNTIRWEGYPITTGFNFELSWATKDFGYTGAADEQKNLNPAKLTYRYPAQTNQWSYDGHSMVSLASTTAGNAPFLGFYFSPEKAGTTGITYQYSLVGSNSQTLMALKGTGIADDKLSPALSLEIAKSEGDIAVATEETFTVKPVYDSKKLSSLGIATDSVQYIMVHLDVTDKSSGCNSGLGTQFTDILQSQSDRKTTQEETDGYTSGGYYHSITGEESQSSCGRSYYFLVSAGKSFKFKVSKRRDSSVSTDYTEYKFYIRGHYPSSPTDYPGSHKTFRLRTSGIVTPANPQLTVNITGTGNGRVTSQPAGIDCPTGTCSYSVFSTNTPITLTATPKDSVVTSNNCPSPFNMPAEGKTCNIAFTKNLQPTNNLPTVQTGANLTSPPNNQQVSPTTLAPMGVVCPDNIPCVTSPCSGDCNSGVQTNDARGLRETTPIAAALQVTFLNAGTGSVQLKSGNTVLREIPINVTEANSGIKINFPTQEGVTWRSNNDDTLTLDASTATQTSLTIQPTLTTFSSSGAVGNTQPLGDIQFTVTKEIKACIDPIQKFVFPFELTTNCLNSDITRLWKVVSDDNINHSFEEKGGKSLKVDKPSLVNLLLLDNQQLFIDVYSWSSDFSSLDAAFDARVNARTIIATAKDGATKYGWWLDNNPLTDKTTKESQIPTEGTLGDQRIVTLQVTDSNGGKSSVAKIVKTVAQQSPEIKSITPTPNDNSANGFSVLLTATACDPDNLDATGKDQCSGGTYDGIKSYQWQIDKDAQEKGAEISSDTSTVTLIFGNAASINIQLQIQDDDNVPASKNLTLTKPVANFTVNQNAEKVELDGSIARGLVINHSSDTGKIDGFHYHWSITPSACPDNSASERAKCTLSPGIYKVKLQIIDTGGFQATSEEKEVFVGLPLKVGEKTVFAVNNTGTPLEITDGWFHSGIIADNGTFMSPLTDGTIKVIKGQPVTIKTTVGVPQDYQNKKGNILIVLGSNGNFQAVNANKCTGARPYDYPPIKLDGTVPDWVNQLVENCYQQVDLLSPVQDVSYPEIFSGELGTYDVYIGIESLNSIFYSPVPLKVKVVE